jgi:hypothetical protein
MKKTRSRKSRDTVPLTMSAQIHIKDSRFLTWSFNEDFQRIYVFRTTALSDR